MSKRLLAIVLGLALLGTEAATAAPARAATPFPNVNITKLAGNQSEAAIAIDPLDPTHVVEFSNRERGAGMYVASSVDGGATWTVSSFARDDRFGKACCDPTLSWDAYGNLFMAWLDIEDSGAIPVAISTDGGLTFRMLKVLRPGPPKRREAIAATEARRDDGEGDGGEKPGGGEKEREPSPKGSSVDQPTIVAGQGSVWVTWNNNGIMQAAGAAVSGLGQVGKFAKREDIPKTNELQLRRHRDRADRPGVRGVHQGQGGHGPDGRDDPRGHRPRRARAARLQPRRRRSGRPTSQQFDPILPQRSRTVDAETGLAWDTDQSSPHFGRLYLMWTDEQPNESSDTDVWLRSSDDAGVTWSAPVRVNDVTTNAQFLPRIALDPTTGNLAFGWHDARNDLGDHGTGDTDGKVNTDAMYYVTFSTDGGATFAPAVAASTGVSNAKDAQNGIDFGDYSGLAFFGGVAMAGVVGQLEQHGRQPRRRAQDVRHLHGASERDLTSRSSRLVDALLWGAAVIWATVDRRVDARSDAARGRLLPERGQGVPRARLRGDGPAVVAGGGSPSGPRSRTVPGFGGVVRRPGGRCRRSVGAPAAPHRPRHAAARLGRRRRGGGDRPVGLGADQPSVGGSAYRALESRQIDDDLGPTADRFLDLGEQLRRRHAVEPAELACTAPSEMVRSARS